MPIRSLKNLPIHASFLTAFLSKLVPLPALPIIPHTNQKLQFLSNKIDFTTLEYSSTPQIVGYTDGGKAVYRKYMSSALSIYTNTWIWTASLPTNADLISLIGIMDYTSNTQYVLPYVDGSSSAVVLSYEKDTGYIKEKHNSSDFNSKTIKLIAEYTLTS